MALATLAQIRAGLNTRLATITGLQTYAYRPGVPTAPCAFVNGVRDVEYHQTMQTGLVTWPMSVWVLVSAAPPSAEAQADLDEYISPTGTNSIKTAIEGGVTGQTLSGIVADVVVESCSGESILVLEDGAYFGAEFLVRVWAGA